MRVFPNFPPTAVCPLCETNEDKETVLVPVDGTEDADGNVRAQPTHVECLLDLQTFKYLEEHDIYYKLGASR